VGASAYSAVSGGSITLVCSIISSNPTATSVIWEKDINGSPTNVRNFMSSRISGGTVSQPSLTITSLTGSDTGRYYCSAENSVGTGSRSATDLSVQSKEIEKDFEILEIHVVLKKIIFRISTIKKKRNSPSTKDYFVLS
jgi:PKD repeat protein